MLDKRTIRKIREIQGLPKSTTDFSINRDYHGTLFASRVQLHFAIKDWLDAASDNPVVVWIGSFLERIARIRR